MDRYTDPTEQQRWRLRTALYRAGRDLAQELATEQTPLAEPLDTGAAPGEQARAALALLHTLTLAQAEIEWLRAQAARAAGATRPDTDITYADIGAAAGITRQSARTRWPETIPDARPGRPPLPPTTRQEHQMETDNPWPDDTACEVYYPPAGADPNDRTTWAWLPGTVTERIGPDEWAVDVDGAAHPELVTRADGTPAPPDADEDGLVYPVCFRDRTEIRPRQQ